MHCQGNGKKAGDDSLKQKLLLPNILHPLYKVLHGVGLHVKEAVARVNYLPGRKGEKEGEPGYANKDERKTWRHSVCGSGHCNSIQVLHHQSQRVQATRLPDIR